MHPTLRTLGCFAVLASLPMSEAFAQHSPGRAPSYYAVCAACHTSDGSNGLGPSMKGVFGRKAGSLGGFTYSRAMRNAGVTWDEKALDAFLAEPQKAIPGNTMPFSGIPDPNQRAEIIDYLKTVK